MAGSNRLRVGVIGCGTVAQIMHLPYLHSLPDLFQIAALSDLSPSLLKALGERYGVPEARRFTDYRDLLATDVVLIDGSSTSLAKQAEAAGAKTLMMTGSPDRIVEFDGSGQPYLSKPFPPEAFLQRVEHILATG